jgi:membrane-associated phospholipid phosphatase
LVWAPLVALARVAMGVHYLSDIVAGALLGLVVGLALTLFL